jgi:hypothetical protein
VATNKPSEPESSREPSMGQVVEALRGIADAIAANAGVGSGTSGSFDGDGFRTPSEQQARAALDYRLLSQLVGRDTGTVAVSAQRFLDQGFDRITFFEVPDEAVAVNVLRAGAREVEVLGFDSEPVDGQGTVTLVDAQGQDISRTELVDESDLPIRIGPALPATTDIVVF